jgi:hypothetical protein
MPQPTPTKRAPQLAPCDKPRPTPDSSTPLWQADHETGDLSQWLINQDNAVYLTGTGSVTITQQVAHSGCYAIALSIRDAVTQTQAARIMRWDDNLAEGYYSAWFYFPQIYRPNLYWGIFQFKSTNGARNDPIWIVNVGNRPTGEMYLYLFDWIHRKGYEQTLLNVPVGKWTNITAYYRRSLADTGQITVWQDGVKLFDFNQVQTAIADDVVWGLNNYTNGIVPGDATIYVDDAVISQTQAGLPRGTLGN